MEATNNEVFVRAKFVDFEDIRQKALEQLNEEDKNDTYRLSW